MRVLQEKEVRDLRRTRNIVDAKGGKLKSALLHKKPKLPLSSEEKQVLALETIAAEIKLFLQTNDKNSIILLEMISKINTDIRMPEYPKPTKKWKFDVSRNGDGFIKQITAEAI